MRITIEIVTGYSNYSSLIWTKENQEQYPTHPDYQHEDDQEYFKQIQDPTTTTRNPLPTTC